MGTRDTRNGPRHSGEHRSPSGGRAGASRSAGTSRPRREPLQDNYYYEEPPRGWKEGDGFQDISSYSSPAKRRADQQAMEQERRSAKKRSETRASRRNASQEIYSSSRPVRKRFGWGKLVLALVLVLVVAVGGSFVYMLSGLTMTSLDKSDSSLGFSSAAVTDSQIVNIALFGLDSRENEDSGRADVTMILSVDMRHHALKLISILRDSEVYIEGYGYDKITHAYAYGGPELAVKTLNQNFQLDIKNYVTVNFYQMAEIVEAFGGIDMELTAEEVYQLNQNLWTLGQESPGTVVSTDYIRNIYGEVNLVDGPFEDGTYHLNGNQAVAYARIRHSDSDDVRASRQQEVLQALLEKAKSNPFLLPARIRKVFSICETSLSVGDMLGMTPIVLGGLNLKTLTIPGEEEQAYGAYLDSGAWVYEYDLTQAAQHINRFIYEEESPYYTGAE